MRFHKWRRHAEEGSHHFPDKNENWKTGCVTTNNRIYVVTHGTIRMKVKQMINNESFYGSSIVVNKNMDLDALLIFVHRICRFTSRGHIDHNNRYVIYTGAMYMWVYKVLNQLFCQLLILYTGQTKREGNIWHNLGGNTIILFYNINYEYINIKQIN